MEYKYGLSYDCWIMKKGDDCYYPIGNAEDGGHILDCVSNDLDKLKTHDTNYEVLTDHEYVGGRVDGDEGNGIVVAVLVEDDDDDPYGIIYENPIMPPMPTIL